MLLAAEMDDSMTILKKTYQPSKNYSYRLPYQNLHMMWDIFNTLDDSHSGFIAKEDLGTALRAAGLIISNGQIEDLIYENSLEEAKEISMDMYFILVARYHRDQTISDGKLVDGTFLYLPKVGKVRVVKVERCEGDPSEPNSMIFGCKIVVEEASGRRMEDRQQGGQVIEIPWVHAKYSRRIQEWIRHHDNKEFLQLIPHFEYQEDEMGNKAVKGAFLGMYTDITAGAGEKKKIYEKSSFGKIKMDPLTGKPVVKRHQQFVAPDDIIRKKLCDVRSAEALSDAEYDKFMSALPTGEDIYVRENPDGPSFSKDMEGVFDAVMETYHAFLLDEDEDLNGSDADDDVGMEHERDSEMESPSRTRSDPPIPSSTELSLSMRLKDLEKGVEKGVMSAIETTEKGLQAGLDGMGVGVDIFRSKSGSVSDSDLSDFKNQGSEIASITDGGDESSSTSENPSSAMDSAYGEEREEHGDRDDVMDILDSSRKEKRDVYKNLLHDRSRAINKLVVRADGFE